MLLYRLSAAVLCALLLSSAIVSTKPSCGRKVTPAGAACCRNEVTCPMHRSDGGALGINACHGDGADTAAVVIHHRAVLTCGIYMVDDSQGGRAFESARILLPLVSVIPRTPPPRIG
jgi:hypothetical protein